MGQRLKALLKERKIKQRQLAEWLDMEPSQISQIVIGNRHPKVETWEKIAEKLDTTVDYFRYGVKDYDEKELLRTYRNLKALHLEKTGLSLLKTLAEGKEPKKKKVSNDN